MMSAEEFKEKVESAISQIDSVQSIFISIIRNEVFGRANFEANCFLNLRYNAKFVTLSFALVFDGIRIWGIDRDTKKGWHRHPLYNIEVHEPIDEPTINDIIDELQVVLINIIEPCS